MNKKQIISLLRNCWFSSNAKQVTVLTVLMLVVVGTRANDVLEDVSNMSLDYKEYAGAKTISMRFTTMENALQTTITGMVVDQDNQPLPGASVVEKGTTNGAQTDFDGNFSIAVGANATLLVSYIGYASKEVALNGQTTLTVQLEESASGLDEVVVIG